MPNINNCLCFTANTAGSTIAMSITGTPTLGQNFQTSTDGSNWTTFTPGTTTITLANVGDKVYFKGDNLNGISQSKYIYYQFTMTGSIAASGNIMSLIDDGNCTCITIPRSHCFIYLFTDCASLTTAPELPATSITQYCYYEMFRGCTSLTTAPELPSTIMRAHCYDSMFYECSSLTTAPELPATSFGELAIFCYQYMFGKCVALTTAPKLPATKLSPNCYEFMFKHCTALTIPPVLPATTLADFCYYNMFSDCTSLTTAPTLPATTLAKDCYKEMFQGCTSLIVSDTQTEAAQYAWRIPTSGTFTDTCQQDAMFYGCSGTETSSSNNMPGEAGQSYTYYTQNEPIQYFDAEVTIKYKGNTIAQTIEKNILKVPVIYNGTEVQSFKLGDDKYLNIKDKICTDYIQIGNTVLNTKDKLLTDFIECRVDKYFP